MKTMFQSSPLTFSGQRPVKYILALGVALSMITAASAQTDSIPPKRGEINSNEVGGKGKEKPESDIKTLFGSADIVHGGYGGASVVYTEFNKKGGLLVGGRGGWIINHAISLGIGGYGITNKIDFKGIVENDEVTLNGGYGGMYIEFFVFPKQPIHLAFPILVGAGGVSYSLDRYDADLDNDDEDFDPYFVDDDAFFVLEPGVEIELNVLRNFRVAFGASYRYLADMSLINTESDAFDGIATGISFKFGKF